VFTTKANKTVATISMRAWSYMKDVYVDVNTFQINEGTKVLPYEPYVGGIYSPNPGQTIKQYKTEEIVTSADSVFENLTNEYTFYPERPWVMALNQPIIFSENSSVKVTTGGISTDSMYDVIMIGSSPDGMISGTEYVELARGNGEIYEVVIDPQGYPNGAYIGVGNTDTGLTLDNVSYYIDLAKNAHITFTQTVQTEIEPLIIPAFPQPIQNANDNPKNLFDESLVTVGKHISAEGAEANNSFQRLSNYIEIEPSTTYRLSDIYNEFTPYTNSSQDQYDRCACYDESKTLISVLFNITRSRKGQHTTTFETPENAKYIRITQGKFAESTMLTKGEEFVPYIPFGYAQKLVLHGANLVNDVYNVFWSTATYVNLLKKVTKDGRNCIYYTFNTGRTYVIEGGFKENTQYTVSFDWFVGADKYGSNKYTPILTIQYTDGTTASINNNELVNNKYVQVQYEWRHASYKTAAGKTVKALASTSYANNEIWIDRDTFMFQEGTVETPYEPYFREEIYIPTEIMSTADKPIITDDVVLADGKIVPLLFSKWDKLTVDRLNNKVVYTEGSLIHSLTGNETKFSTVSGNGNNYRVYFESLGIKGRFVNKLGYCTHFKGEEWNPLSRYGTYASRITDIIFRIDGKQTLDEFLVFLKEQYANGTPVIFICKRQTPIEHDITSTDLGQSLLMLATQNGTNIIEISGNLTPTLTVKHLTHS